MNSNTPGIEHLTAHAGSCVSSVYTRLVRVGLSRGGLAALGAAALMLFAGPRLAAGMPAVEPSGAPGCVDTEGSFRCAAAPSLAGLSPDQMVVSPNGRFVYGWQGELLFSPGAPHARLLVFARNLRSGALHPLRGRRGCIENAPGPVARQRGPCERVGGLEQPVSLVISPDGLRLYASGRGGHEGGGSYLVTFAVDPRKGTLRRLQCLTDLEHSRCAFAPIPSEGRLLVASDSRSVYVGDAFRPAIDVYQANTRGLVLKQCLVASPGPGCAVAPLLPVGGVHGLAESPDGSELYAAGSVGEGAERIVGLGRGVADGLLTPPSGPGDCVSDEPHPPAGCSGVTLTGSVLSLNASGDTLYAASVEGFGGSNLTVAALTRDPTSGALSELPGAAGCVVFAATPLRGCGTAPRWIVDFPYTAPAASGGLLLSAVEHQHHVGTVVQVGRSSTGVLVVDDLRECGPGVCHRFRGAYGELIGPVASSPDGRSVYLSQGDGIAQLRIPR